MKPVDSNVQPTNDHSYPAYDYPVGIGTGLIAVKNGVIRDMPGVPTRQLFSGLQNGQAWPNAGGGSPNSGNVICIDHGNGEWTAYLHDSPYSVEALRNRPVKQGELFGRSGNNGWSTGPHLHFEVWKNGQRIDPGPWLANIKKEEDMADIANSGDVKNQYKALLHREATQQDIDVYVGPGKQVTFKQLVEAIESSPEFAKVQAGLGEAQVLSPGTYKVN